MRKTGKTLVLAAMAAVAAGMTSPALAATARHEPASRSAVAFSPETKRSVVDWNRELITILGTAGAQPATVHPTRSFAILQAAEYDAVNSITRAAPSYRFRVPAPRGARPDAAADTAAHDVLTVLYPALKAGPDQLLAGELAAIPDSRGKQQGIRVGETVAKRLIGLRSSDGSATTPPPIIAATYARALNQVKRLGQDSSTTRTADETTLAKFWGAAPIWNVWNQIAQKLAVTRHATLEQAVTVFANLDLTLADATIGLYDAKYHYLVWRPITAIQEGSTAGNPRIIGDPGWNPLAVTAPDPSYPGAHATISQAAATVLSAFYGDHQRLTVRSDADPGVTRTFGSFQAAANEATLSRIFAGQHTIIDLVAGQQLGHHVADFVLHHLGSAPAHAR